MAPTSPKDQALLREVNDAVRQDAIVGIWRRYGLAIIGLILATLIAFGGWLWWRQSRNAAAGEMAELLQKVTQAVQANGKPDLRALEALTKSDAGYRVSALMIKARLATLANRDAEAIALYKGIADDGSLPKPYQDLGLIRQISLEFDKMKPDDIIARLKTLAEPGNPWFGSAGEMTAIAYIKKREFKVAGALFASLAQDKDVPNTIKSRAVQMAGLLGVDMSSTSF